MLDLLVMISHKIRYLEQYIIGYFIETVYIFVHKKNPRFHIRVSSPNMLAWAAEITYHRSSYIVVLILYIIILYCLFF